MRMYSTGNIKLASSSMASHLLTLYLTLTLYSDTVSFEIPSLSQRWPSLYSVPGSLYFAAIHPMGYNNLTHCSTSSYTLMLLGLVYIWAVEQVNKDPKLLPNHTLGLHIGDSCSSERRGLTIADQFVLEGEDRTDGQSCENKRAVGGVVGCLNSGCTHQASFNLQMKNLTLISPTATATNLEDKRRHPFLFRMVPSNGEFVSMLIQVLKRYQFTLLSMIYVASDYGQSFFRQFQQQIHEHTDWHPCISFVTSILPGASKSRLRDVARQLSDHKRPRARVVLVITKYREAIMLAREYNINLRLNQTWALTFIFPDSIISMENLARVVENAVVLTYPAKSIPELRRYLFNRTFTDIAKMPWAEQFRAKFIGRTNYSRRWSNVTWKELIDLGIIPQSRFKAFFDRRQSIIADSVFTIARSLTNAVKNCSKNCFDIHRLLPILQEEINPSRRRSTYELLWPTKSKGGPNPLTLVYSNCTPICNGLRSFMQVVPGGCCPICRHCHSNEILGPGRNHCITCPPSHWPTDTADECHPLLEVYLGYKFTHVVFSLFFTFLLGVLLVVCVVIFIRNRNHRVIKASAIQLTLLKAFGLGMVLAGLPLFCVCPTDSICNVRFALLNAGIALTYSALLVKTIRIWRIFSQSRRGNGEVRFIDNTSQLTINAVIWILMILILVVTLITDPIKRSLNVEIVTDCKNCNSWHFGHRYLEIYCSQSNVTSILPYAYNVLLMTLCLVFAFRTRNLPYNFNESRFIFYCVFSSLIVDVLLVPCYHYPKLRMYKSLSILIISLFNVAVFIGSLFLPRFFSLYRREQQQG